jgi:hypothetical protein
MNSADDLSAVGLTVNNATEWLSLPMPAVQVVISYNKLGSPNAELAEGIR